MPAGSFLRIRVLSGAAIGARELALLTKPDNRFVLEGLPASGARYVSVFPMTSLGLGGEETGKNGQSLEKFPEARGFDFLYGRWDVIHRKLRKRLAGDTEWYEFPGTLEVDPILEGLGNFDVNELADPAGGYHAHSLRLFNPGTKLWSIWWLASNWPGLDPPVVGGFSGTKGTFFSQDVFNSRPIRVRTTYEPVDEVRAQWTQAFSPDDGGSWEVNWIMNFVRPGI